VSFAFNKVQDVLENYKSAIYEKDVERFVSTFASDMHIYDCWENWECIGISRINPLSLDTSSPLLSHS
jgi:hypothetical protein